MISSRSIFRPALAKNASPSRCADLGALRTVARLLGELSPGFRRSLAPWRALEPLQRRVVSIFSIGAVEPNMKLPSPQILSLSALAFLGPLRAASGHGTILSTASGPSRHP
jgi:hypothetical protein